MIGDGSIQHTRWTSGRKQVGFQRRLQKWSVTCPKAIKEASTTTKKGDEESRGGIPSRPFDQGLPDHPGGPSLDKCALDGVGSETGPTEGEKLSPGAWGGSKKEVAGGISRSNMKQVCVSKDSPKGATPKIGGKRRVVLKYREKGKNSFPSSLGVNGGAISGSRALESFVVKLWGMIKSKDGRKG